MNSRTNDKPTVGIIDYGMGNLGSVSNALDYLNYTNKIIAEPKLLKSVDMLILPGVGAFGEAMSNLRTLGFMEPLNEMVCVQHKPLLGICLGMQLLATSSEEKGIHQGLNWIPGTIRRLPIEKHLHLPHMGWNNLIIKNQSSLYSKLEGEINVYFVHSYYYEGDDNFVDATVEYGIEFPAAISKDNIVGMQFHPEKSHKNGLFLLKSFLEQDF